MGSQSIDLVEHLIKFDVFKEVVDKSHNILKSQGFSVYDLFYNFDENTFTIITNVIITIVIVQVLFLINTIARENVTIIF